MNRITAGVQPGTTGPQVADLQNGLALILERDGLGLAATDRSALLAGLRAERHESAYRDVTARLVSLFQERGGLPVTGEVGADTAAALNDELARLGAFDPPSEQAQSFIVAGTVTDEDGGPYAGPLIAAYHADEGGPIRLGTDQTDAEGRYTIRFSALPGVGQLDLVVEAVNTGSGGVGGEVVARSDRRPLTDPVTRVDLVAERPAVPAATAQVTGRIVLDNGAPAAGLGVRLHQLEFGGRSTPLANAVALESGDYTLTYPAPGRTLTVEVRALGPADAEVALSAPVTVPPGAAVTHVDLVAAADLVSAGPEYQRLMADLAPWVGEPSSLAGTREDDRRRDLSALRGATGWDARLIALAATAQRLAQDQAVGLPAEGLYGLFRAGLPADQHLLARAAPADVSVALRNLVTAGIVAMTDAEIEQFTQRFTEFARTTRLAVPAAGSRTTYGELLAAAEVGDAAETFADMFVTYRGDSAGLWLAALAAGVPDEPVAKLRWQGKLAFLAGNSGPVTMDLMATLSHQDPAADTPLELRDPVALVDLDLYEADGWAARIGTLAHSDDELDALVPAVYEGATPTDRLNAYAADLARKIRLSYPTEVVTRMVETDRIPLDNTRDATVAVLREITPRGFRLGHTPVDRFLAAAVEEADEAAAPRLAAGPDAIEVARREIKTLHRLYQITPDNESMPVLKALGLESAFDVTALREEEFRPRFDEKYRELHGRLPAGPASELVWRKAQQVSSATYNLFGAVKSASTAVGLPALAGAPERRDRENAGLAAALKGYPTMEELFGSMDFCDCEHCRSVLSPAAYLVDLLQFVEAEQTARDTFLAGWTERNPKSYPESGFLDPYDALTKRRPDLPHIPLTCENTNVELPYIDVVNEILEFYLANGGLAADAARDTGAATSAELLAEPTNIIVEAYQELAAQRYPLTLPFDLWLQIVREFGDYAGTPLRHVLEVLRDSDELLPAAPASGWAGIFIESLGLSPAERGLFADPDPLAAWWTLYGYGSLAEATTEATENGGRVDLNSAKALARRLGVSYEELATLIQARFVNPSLAKLGPLYKIPATIAETKIFLDAANQAFLAANQDLLAPNPDLARQARIKAMTAEDWIRLTDLSGFADRLRAHAASYGQPLADVVADLKALPLAVAVVLADPDAGCDFDQTIVRHADGGAADAEVFLRLNLFVRLWRRLGWTVDDLDRALAVFIPSAAPFAAGHYAEKPLETALIYLAHLRELEGRLAAPPDRIRLLTLWTDIPTEGPDNLYARLFLRPSVLKVDPIFDHPRGDYLAAAWVAAQGAGKPAAFTQIAGHLQAIQAALGLTATEVTEITADAGLGTDAGLTIANLSVLHRYGLLAQGLGLSVDDLITLKQLSGSDPFTALAATVLTDLDQDNPYRRTLGFVKQAETIRASGLSIADLDFLLRRRFDDAGPRHYARPAALAALTTLADGVREIRRQHALPADPDLVTEDFVQHMLSLLLSSADTATALRMLRGEATATRAFFDDVLRRRPVGPTGTAGFLDDEDYPSLFEPLEQLATIDPADPPERVKEKQDANKLAAARNLATLRARRNRLAAAVLPVLRDRLSRAMVTQTLAARTSADPDLVERLLTDPRLLGAGPDGDRRPLLAQFLAAATDGVDADFYLSADGSDPRQDTPATVTTTDTAARPATGADGAALPAAGSARFQGYLVPPATGPYRFAIDLAKKDANARLEFPHLADPVFLDVTAATVGATFGAGPDEYLTLEAGVPYRFTFELDDLAGGSGQLTVWSETVPRGPLSRLPLYPVRQVEAAEHAYLRLAAAVELLGALGLAARETTHLATNAAGWGDLDLGDLPARPFRDRPEDRTAAVKRFGWFLRLVEYAGRRRELAGGTDALIDVFEAAAVGGADPSDAVYRLLGATTRRGPDAVWATTKTIFPAADGVFTDDRPLARLWDALTLVERLGSPAGTIKGWTAITAPVGAAGAPTNEQRFAIAQDVKETVRSRLDPAAWQRAAQPIFDRLRGRQRDALVAAITHREKLSGPEELYEHFLLDPGMEPVVRTSRIRLAISSVRLFVQRCLLNLEKEVHPTAILNAEQWDWMRRYRVWEANRRIFLYPENWLEPEFRDDKTHLYQELESALLTEDVSADVAEDAFLDYLSKLAELAKLEIVAMHLQDAPDLAHSTLHVFGRTHSAPHKYFYRRYANSAWTPWEPVGVEIEGDHLAPVVWRGRLYLFWVTFLELGHPDGDSPKNVDHLDAMPTVKHDVEAQLHWSEYTAGAWGQPQSGGYRAPIELRVRGEDVGDHFDPLTVPVHVTVLEPPDVGAETIENLRGVGVYITLGDPIGQSFYLASRHSAPVADAARPAPNIPFGVETDQPRRRPTAYVGSPGRLTVSFRPRIIIGPGQPGAAVTPESRTIFGTTGPFTLLPVNNRITLGMASGALGAARTWAERFKILAALESTTSEIESLIKPVFFQDAHQVLFLEPEVTERTVQQWEEWVTRTPMPEPELPTWHHDPRFWEESVKPFHPVPVDPLGPVVNPTVNLLRGDSLVQLNAGVDWLVNPGTGLLFDGQVINGQGLAPVAVVAAADLPAASAQGAVTVRVSAGSGIATDAALVVPGWA
ncbi:neuraminidase-like domain-containing protein, partial [Frankia sp. Cas3]|uniref:neuraminidase-like domain-containing protein n=1 Tax=Frankia sp. Cas3 TaxID=3073926 RepID=UPI002AD38909